MTSRDVLIGWNATPQAARAVTAALAWLSSAHRVHVLEADDPAPHYPGKLESRSTCNSRASCWRCIATAHRRRSFGDTLLSFASEVGADLLVMGCCGQSRVRELMLGGASRSVLKLMTLPVLMAH